MWRYRDVTIWQDTSPTAQGGRAEILPQREARTSNDVPGLKRRTRPSVRLMSFVTDSGDGKHQYAYGRTDGSRAHSAHRHQGWHISSGPEAVAAERGNPAPQRRPGGRCGRSRTPSPTTPPTASPSRADAAEAQTGFADAAWKTARPEPRALHRGQHRGRAATAKRGDRFRGDG